MTTKQNTINMPAAKVMGYVEQTIKTTVDSRTGLTTNTIAQEESLGYVAGVQQRIDVLAKGAEASKSLCAVCLSIVADVIDNTPHIANMAKDAKTWKQAFAKVEDIYFPNGTMQMWQTTKSTIKAWLAKDEQALTGDRIIKTADGQLNSLRYIKSLTPKAERVSQTVAEKVIEACDKENGPTVGEVVKELAHKVHDTKALLDTLIEACGGEEKLRVILAERIKARRAESKGLKLAA